MTREEAREKMFYQWQDFLEHNIDYAGVCDAYKMAIQALEQEPILDKIRAEIMSKDGLEEALEIIDKYRGESDCRECKVEHDCYECKKYAESEES